MKMLLRAIALGAVLLSVAACGPDNTAPAGPGEGDDPAQTGAVDPCGLISAAELGTVVATVEGLATAPELSSVGPVGEFQGRSCTWTYPRDELVTDTAEITVTAWHGQEYYTPDALPADFTAVPGIGDAAHVGPGMFIFRVGDEVISVEVTGDSNLEALRPAIATAIDAKL